MDEEGWTESLISLTEMNYDAYPFESWTQGGHRGI